MLADQQQEDAARFATLATIAQLGDLGTWVQLFYDARTAGGLRQAVDAHQGVLTPSDEAARDYRLAQGSSRP